VNLNKRGRSLIKNNSFICSSCLRKIASEKNFRCGICESLLCKDCAQFQEESFFSFFKEVPKTLSHPIYCASCYAQEVEKAKGPYLELLEKAKEVYVFFEKRAVPLIRRSKTKVSVEGCPDRDETLLRLAFFAAEQSFNALVEVELTSEKVFNHGYQSLMWSGSAHPAQVRAASLDENRWKKKKEIPQPERILKKKKK